MFSRAWRRPGRLTAPRQRPAETPNPNAAALPAARPVPLHLPIPEAIENQHRYVSLGRAATAGTIAFQALAVLQEVAEGNQSRRVGVHGRSMMPGQVQGVSLNSCLWIDSAYITLHRMLGVIFDDQL